MDGYFTYNISERLEHSQGKDRQPFPHQSQAFSALSKVLTLPVSDYKGTLLVFPTAGGKTYTSVNWICKNILSKGVKVLWLAQSSFLLDQAVKTFKREIHNAHGREFINLRVVSSSKKHANAGTISISDDILVCTTQTAIGAYSSIQLDGRGNKTVTPFRKFINDCKDEALFVVVDEAHHTPAYGCRTLLISMREQLKNLYILGLTATPMHMDKRISGWLKRIYDHWICYEADKNKLQMDKVLAVPKYTEVQTGMEVEVNDSLYDRLVRQHKDVPDHIIEYLASNQPRNDKIVSEYVKNRDKYGKTLIFADRWFQCEYLVDKLQSQGVKAAAVYSVITGAGDVYQGGSGRRNDTMNREIMEDFDINQKYDVLINVRMLTEGVDLPDVKTVMITRQTTSNILMTQMIGRALRGEKTGGGPGKDYANIVFFHDTWKRLLPWVDVSGGTEGERPPRPGRNPMSLISIQLIKLAVQDMEYQGFENMPFLTFIPVGFYACEYSVLISEEDQEEMISFEENTIAYDFNKEKYEQLISTLTIEDLISYASENVEAEMLRRKAQDLATQFFDMDKDNFDESLIENIEKIIRHIAQNEYRPVFIDFHERDVYDMDKIARDLIDTPLRKARELMISKFEDSGLYWNFLYKTRSNFMAAFYNALESISDEHLASTEISITESPQEQLNDLTPEIRTQVYTRDRYTCVCCSKAQRKGVTLNIDHILPVSMGGTNDLCNLQTLCRNCNAEKGVNEIDYRATTSPLRRPKGVLNLVSPAGSDEPVNAIARIVNEFYHCKAMCKLNNNKRSNGKYYSEWEIVLYSGNDPEWLEVHNQELLNYIRSKLSLQFVMSIAVKN